MNLIKEEVKKNLTEAKPVRRVDPENQEKFDEIKSQILDLLDSHESVTDANFAKGNDKRIVVNLYDPKAPDKYSQHTVYIDFSLVPPTPF